jgi:small GTP-binding protein
VAEDVKLDPEQERAAEREAARLRETLAVKPRIALVGFSGAGKSCLFNAILGRPVSEEPAGGVKGTMAARPQEHQGFVLVDCPGYGAANMHPPEIILKETMDPHLIVQVLNGAEAIHDQDVALHRVLSRHVKTIVTLNKIDILDAQERAEAETAVFARMGVLRQLFLPVSARTGQNVVDLVRLIARELPTGAREGFLGSLEGHLGVKEEEAGRLVQYYSNAGAVIGLTPIPFADLVALFGLQVAMAIHLGVIYGRGDRSPKEAAKLVASALGSAYLGRQIARQIGKIVPGLGSAIGAATAWASMRALGAVIVRVYATASKIPKEKLAEYFRSEYARAEAEARAMDFSRLKAQQQQGGRAP